MTTTLQGPLDPLGLKRLRRKYGWNNWRILISAVLFSFCGVTAANVYFTWGLARPGAFAVIAAVSAFGFVWMIIEFRRRHGIRRRRMPRSVLKRRIWIASLVFVAVGVSSFALLWAWLMTRYPPILPVAVIGIVLTLMVHAWLKRQRRRLQVDWIDEPVRFKATAFGVFHILLTASIGVVALQTGLNLLIGIFAVMLTLIVVSGLLVGTNFAKLRIARELPEEIVAGEPTKVSVHIHNDKRWLPSYSLWLQEGWPQGVREPELLPSAYAVRVPPTGCSELSYQLVFPERGVFRFVGFSVMSRFPFSMFARYRYISDEQEVVVFPPQVRPPRGVMPVATRPSATTSMTSSHFGLGDVRGIRGYVPGIDDVGSIHWPSTARMREPMVRERERETAGSICIVLERGEHGAAFEQAIKLAASLIHEAWRINSPLTLVVPPQAPVTAPSAGIHARRACLEALARLRGYASINSSVEQQHEAQDSSEATTSETVLQLLPVRALAEETATLAAGANERWQLPPGTTVLPLPTLQRPEFHHYVTTALARTHRLAHLPHGSSDARLPE